MASGCVWPLPVGSVGEGEGRKGCRLSGWRASAAVYLGRTRGPRAAEGSNSVGVVVDTSSCRFEGSPRYHASLYASSSHWIVFSAGDIENPDNAADGGTSPDSIRLTLRSSAADGVSAAMARQFGWQVRWCGYGATTKKPPTYSMCCGSSAATGWNDYGGSGAYVNVDTSGCGWTDGPDADRIRPPPPYYFASLSDTSCGTRIGDGCAALASGVNSIYSAIATGFRVYVKPASTFWTQAAKAKDNNWRINWCGIKALPPSSGAGAKAGFPCKSLPLSLRHASGLSTACAIVTGIIGFTSHVSAIAID